MVLCVAGILLDLGGDGARLQLRREDFSMP